MEEGFWAAVVVCGNAPPVFETAEHHLDSTATAVAALVIFEWRRP